MLLILELFYSWTDISRMLNVSRRSLLRLTHNNEAFIDPHRSSNNDELECALHGYGVNLLCRGEVI